MMTKRSFFAPFLIGAALLVATPSAGQGIGHTVFMRGQVVAMEQAGAVVCIGKADGARPGQVLDVFRVKYRHTHRSSPPDYSRVKVGSVTITEIINDHFARAQVTDGRIKKHDIAELRKD